MAKSLPRNHKSPGQQNDTAFRGYGRPGAGSEFSRRGFIAMGAAVAALAALPATALAGTGPQDTGAGMPSAGSEQWRRLFATPPRSVAPKFRWWWPNGQVDPAEIAREVGEVTAAGFGGLEVSDIHASGLLSLDAVDYGWGSASWVTALTTALTEAEAQGIEIDLTLSPGYPVCAPTITPDSPAASAELAHGVVTVPPGSTYSGPVPAAVLAPGAGVTRQTLVRVQAARTTGATAGGVTPLDQSSVIDLTATVSGGQVSWTAPSGSSSWVLISYWLRGTGQQPKGGAPFMTPTPYVVDHFSVAGTQAVTGMWEQLVLTDRIKRLLRTAGNAFFEDSLELSTTATIWTPELLTAFEQSLGYDLLPYLPVVVTINGKYQFSYAGTVSTHVRDDVNTVLSALYQVNHLLGFQGWANRLGLQYRMQPYGLSTDSLYFAAFLDVPEGETLGFKNLDDYRVLCGGRDLAGHLKLSCEAIAYANGAYSTTWNKGLQTIGSAYAGGVNQTVVHGFAYSDAPGATWPGFAAWSPYQKTAIGFSEAWGPRQPTWRHMPDVAGYLSRTQWALQTGTPKYDLVFYRQKGYTSTGIGAPWSTNSGIPIGWTHSFATDRALALPGVSVANGTLAANGPEFSAMILGPDQFDGSASQISPEGAHLLLGFAQAGLPTVVLGDWSAPVATGVATDEANSDVAARIAELLSLPTVVNVATQDLIPGALAQLGVLPRVQYTSSTLMTVHRTDADTDVYYVANARHAESRKISPISQVAWLTGHALGAVPYRLDAWTGTITRIAQFTRQGSQVGVPVALNPGESMIVVLAPPGWAGAASAVQVTGTDADAVLIDGDNVVVRAAQAGQYTVTLGDGSTLHGVIGPVPAPVPLTSWTLAAEDWQPGATATETLKPVVTMALSALAAWSAIPGLQDSSGVGHYRTTVTLPATWDQTLGATLSLGTVSDTFRVWVNGSLVPPTGILATSLDVGGLLQAGANTIEVEVATTLLNRLRVVTPAIYGIAARQAYGLIGPVVLTPYGQAIAS
jgi:hypothetical protein